MKLGVIMPTYNQAQYLIAAIGSVVEQVDELVVVDDGSTDSTSVMLEACAGIRVVTHAQNQGTAVAINTGFEALSDCEWVSWVSSDNVHTPNWRDGLFECVADDVGVVYSAYSWDTRHMFTPYDPEHLVKDLNCFFGPSFMIRRDVWQSHRGAISHDYDNWLRVEEACWRNGLSIVASKKDLCWYRVHDERATVVKRHEFDAPRWQAKALARRAIEFP